MKGLLKVFLAPAAMIALMAAVVFMAEGSLGLRPFLNLEAFAIVLIGTALALSVSYPLGEIGNALGAAFGSPGSSPRESEILDCAAGYAMTMGWIGTLLGIIMLLASVADVSEIPRRTALSLDALLFGLMLSKLVLAPAARRLAPARPQGAPFGNS